MAGADFFQILEPLAVGCGTDGYTMLKEIRNNIHKNMEAAGVIIGIKEGVPRNGTYDGWR